MGLVAFIMAYALFAFIFYILQVIAYWKIFTKAGEEGWKSIIPDLQWLCTVPADLGCAVFLGGTRTGGRRRYFKFLRRNRGSYRFACASGNSTHECGGTL